MHCRIPKYLGLVVTLVFEPRMQMVIGILRARKVLGITTSLVGGLKKMKNKPSNINKLPGTIQQAMPSLSKDSDWNPIGPVYMVELPGTPSSRHPSRCVCRHSGLRVLKPENTGVMFECSICLGSGYLPVPMAEFYANVQLDQLEPITTPMGKHTTYPVWNSLGVSAGS